ncbi:TPA: hypothetical protein ACY3HI_004752 [Citrobacter braakii]
MGWSFIATDCGPEKESGVVYGPVETPSSKESSAHKIVVPVQVQNKD